MLTQLEVSNRRIALQMRARGLSESSIKRACSTSIVITDPRTSTERAAYARMLESVGAVSDWKTQYLIAR